MASQAAGRIFIGPTALPVLTGGAARGDGPLTSGDL